MCHFRSTQLEVQYTHIASDQSPSRARFNAAVWRLLARYDSIGGAGFQMAVGKDGFDVLAEMLGVQCECFASPLNCRFDKYCSAFADTDCGFGSAGSFMSFEPTEGSFEANPPFVPGLQCASLFRRYLFSVTQRNAVFLVQK